MAENLPLIPLHWHSIDTVLFDMDGTLLDLHFDNYFWLEYLPQCYSKAHGISYSESRKYLIDLSSRLKGTLNWYCLDYWSDKLSLDIAKLKEDIQHKILFRPNVIELLQHLRSHNKRIILATNAHPKTLELKLLRADFANYFDVLSSSHEIGFPKEEQQYWVKFCQNYQLDPKRCLFIDDSLSVLDSAKQFGIGFVLGICKPDSQKEAVNCSPYTGIQDFSQLIYSL